MTDNHHQQRPYALPTGEKKLSVIIPAYNEERYIGACLQSCLQYAPAHLLEIIVVDNASTDRTREIATQFPHVRVVHEPIKGLTKARQRGLTSMEGNVFFSIDADTRIPPGWFERMQQELERPGVICVTGPYHFYDLPTWQRFFVGIYWGVSAAITRFSTGYMVVGGNFATTKDALLRIGGFDTSIDFYGEDTDIARRLHSIGKIVYSARCWINTSGRRLATEGILRTPFVYAMNYVWIALFHRPFTKKYKDIR